MNKRYKIAFAIVIMAVFSIGVLLFNICNSDNGDIPYLSYEIAFMLLLALFCGLLYMANETTITQLEQNVINEQEKIIVSLKKFNDQKNIIIDAMRNELCSQSEQVYQFHCDLAGVFKDLADNLDRDGSIIENVQLNSYARIMALQQEQIAVMQVKLNEAIDEKYKFTEKRVGKQST